MRFQIIIILSCLMLAACASSPAAPTAYFPPPPTLESLPLTPTVSFTPTPEIGCSAIEAAPTPVMELSASFPVVTQKDFSRGPQNAVVTIIEYCDMQTPACEAVTDNIARVMQNRAQDVRFIFRPVAIMEDANFPLSPTSVNALIAANNQGKFWEVFDLLYQKYNDWANLNPPSAFEGWLAKEVSALGLDGKKFREEIKSGETESAARSYFEAAQAAGITSVPVVLVNGIPQQSYIRTYDGMDATVGLIALGQKQFKECPPFAIDPTRQYSATLKTKNGDIVLKLFPDKAPLAVNSFVVLARSGWFDGITFHRVIPGFMAQTGDPSGTGMGGPGYMFEDETDTGLKFDKPGVVGMANAGPGTNGSQFFITYAPAPHLDGIYTIFGQVISGMDVLEKITPRDPEQPGQPIGDTLISVTVEEK